MTGYLANLALPRIGEITRCVALGKKEKIPVDQLIGTVVIERTIDFISLLTHNDRPYHSQAATR